MIKLWLIVSTVCCGGGNWRGNHTWSGTYKETKTFIQQVHITTVCPTPNELQEVKMLCDFIGHRWVEIGSGYSILWDDDFPGSTRQCIFCGKKQRRVKKIEWVDKE